MYKRNANRKGIEFNLTVEDILANAFENCHYCGSLPRNKLREKDGGSYYQGLDRVDNSNGYTPENIIPCCHFCNNIKGENLTYDEMRFIAKTITKFRSIQQTLNQIEPAQVPEAPQASTPRRKVKNHL